MIAGKQVALVQEDAVPARMAGRGDDRELGREGDGRAALDDDLCAGRGAAVAFMDDALRTEVRGEFRSIGDVVAMREKNEAQAAQVRNPLDERPREAR